MKELYQNKTKWIIGITIFYLLLASYYFFYFQKNMQSLEEKINEKSKLQQNIEMTQMAINESKSDLSVEEPEVTKQPTDEIPSTDHTDEIISTLESLEQSTGVSISNIGFTDDQSDLIKDSSDVLSYMELIFMGSEAEGQTVQDELEIQDVIPNLYEIDISLNLTGTFLQFINFLTQIQNETRFYLVQSIEFQLNGESVSAEQNDSQLESANLNELLTQLDLEMLKSVQGENFESFIDANQRVTDFSMNLSAYYLPEQ
ncbi:hypothetical protein [Chengkuizengella sediminis]|uniref:hypothetical protein n=1 Tax=Chengkuizengella sediminis TaxID=1885917 RepID=UPI00138A591C|nr:hypothetical protein [Chengkuizengella sediminis]NDI35400.1 hypothetical protein [Chengkuizengella sediminis]